MSPRAPRTRPAAPPTRTPEALGPLGVLTAAMLRDAVPPRIYERGVGYAQEGAVLALAWRGAELHAAVEGSEEFPYHVAVRRIARGRAAGDLAAICTCPYMAEWGEWCKHVVAALLVAIDDPAAIAHQPTVAVLLAALDRRALARLLGRLVADAPELYDVLAEEVRASARRQGRDGRDATAARGLPPTPDDPRPRRPPDPRPKT